MGDFVPTAHSSSIIEKTEGHVLRGFGAGTSVGTLVCRHARRHAIVRRDRRQYLEVR
jgi:hypothetical protein